MRRLYIFLFIVALATSGCGSCDDTAGSGTGDNNQTDGGTEADADVNCLDEDNDGFLAGEMCENATDCDDTDASVNPDAMETCGDGIDNNCSGTVDDGCEACTDGDTRECGTDVGACEIGTQTCNGGTWSACEGGVEREAEICDGIDNDCDGELDENPQSLCDDGVLCNGQEMCNAGTCESGEAVDCSELDGACTIGQCAEKDGTCVQILKPDGESCDDGNFCTVNGTCNAGVCETEARDCSGESDQCNTGVCDEEADSCVPQPVSDGTTCDDGAFCTVNDVCTAGVCGGGDRDCSGESDQCNTGICDENADSCVPDPVSDGTTCEDGQYCTVGDSCQAGTCESGGPRQCGAAGGSCRTGVCNETTDQCDGDPVADGTTCDDGSFCTVNDACVAGTCQGGGAKDCSGQADQCNTGLCNDNLNRCEPDPVADGTTCSDGAFCTENDTCQAGTCEGGNPIDCSGEDDQCNTGVCDDTADSCVKQPLSDGTNCSDGQFCTQNDTCQTGTCTGGPPPNCSGLDDQCNTGVCDENADSCVADPVSDGTSCDDGSFCTTTDTCQAGSCDPGPARDCSGLDDQCNTGICDDTADSCVQDPVSDGTTCDDGSFCTTADTCQAGSCDPGPARDCSGLDDQCNTGVCDDSTDSCVQDPVADGTSCSDGEFCTDGDACLAGTCDPGGPRDCSGLDDQCNTGICDESADSCIADPVSDGTTCDDGSFCTTADSCQAGSCNPGPARDCSGLDDQCNTGVCDDNADSCVQDPVSDGTTCDDGSFCTTTDSCQSGSCAPGPARDCSGLDDQCNTGICDDNADSCVQDPVADGTTCSDGSFCTDGDACLAGTCDPGGPRDCSGLNDQCNTGVCDESADSCVQDPVSDGTTCSDGSFCTDGDSCQAGSCDPGPARDCSGLDDQCNTGICDDSADSCVQDPVANGTTCSDGSFCTDGDSCQAGSCDPGPARDCSGLDDQCNTGICDDSTDSCVADPVSDGTSCDDGFYCTSGDTCQTGSCQSGASRDCSGLDDQCNTGVCDESADSCVQDPVSDGTSCDDGEFCTLSDSCQSGTCGGGASRDCSSAGDQCNVGVCDESADSCVADPVSNGISCDDGRFCTTGDSCIFGVCDGTTRDCSAYDSACEEGLCDETNDTCYSDAFPDGTSCNDGLSCTANDTCLGGVCGGSGSEPVADAGPDQNVIPNTTVQLDGTGSSDPDGQSLTYNWTVSSRPSGSSATISDPSDPTPTLLADVAGTYEICLTVTDSDGCQSSSDCMTVTVVPQADLLIELVWFSDNSDIDLHFRAANGTYLDLNKTNCNNSDQGTAVWFCILNPDWGLNGEGQPDGIANNDPRLDVDNTTGYGPENINQDVLFDTAGPERVALHYYADKGAGNGVSARVRIYVSGVLQFEDTRALDCQDFWEVADIEVSNSGTTVSITPVDQMSTETRIGSCP